MQCSTFVSAKIRHDNLKTSIFNFSGSLCPIVAVVCYTSIPKKSVGDKQRKETLEKYQTTFLQVPRINDRKPVFISSDVRDRLDRIVRVLGGRRMSVSGIIENIIRHHLNLYEEDFEAWRKL